MTHGESQNGSRSRGYVKMESGIEVRSDLNLLPKYTQQYIEGTATIAAKFQVEVLNAFCM